MCLHYFRGDLYFYRGGDGWEDAQWQRRGLCCMIYTRIDGPIVNEIGVPIVVKSLISVVKLTKMSVCNFRFG